MKKIILPYNLKYINGIDIVIFCYIYQLGYNITFSDYLYISIWDISKYTGLKPIIIKDSINKLITLPEVLIQDLDHGHYSIKLDTLFNTRNSFIILQSNDVSIILKHKLRYNLLYLYTLILKRVDLKAEVNNHKYFVTDVSIAYFSKALNVSDQTIIKYIQILEELNIIYVFRVHNMQHNNLIGLIDNKELINEWAELCGYTQNNIDYEVNTRAIIQKYRALCNGKQYSPEEIGEIRKGIEIYNTLHPNKKKDMVVFN